MEQNVAVQAGVDDPILKVTGKSRWWLLGILFLIFSVCSVGGFVIGIIYSDLWYFMLIFGELSFFSFVMAGMFIFDDKKAIVKYDPNNKILNVIMVKNFISRIFCKEKEITRTMQIKDISIVLSTKGCCLYKFHAAGIASSSIITKCIFKAGQLDPIINTIQPIIHALNVEREKQRQNQLNQHSQQQQIIFIVQNAEEFIRQNPNAQIQVIQNPNAYNPPVTLPQQLQQQIQFNQQQQPSQYTSQNQPDSYPAVQPVYSAIQSVDEAPPQYPQIAKT